MADSFRIHVGKTPGIQVVAAASRHVFARHTHEEFGIGFITAGAQRWHSDRAEVESGPGKAIAVNPGEVHDGAPVGDAGRAWRMLYVDPALLDAASSEVFERRSGEFRFSRPVMDDPRIASVVAQLIKAEVRGGSTPRCEELLLAMTALAGDYRVPAQFAAPASVARVKQRIDDDPASPVSLGELSQIAGVSRFHLLRGFARATGLTPHAYLVQRRIDLARRLIATGAKLADVAVATGFSDQSHMTNTFVRKYGLSPGAYARALS